jgi:hypothetical protein
MAATKNLINYETPGAITCTLPSLAIGSTRESNVVDNTTNKFLDDLIAVTFTIASGTPTTAGPAINVYAAGSVDGTLFPITQLSSGAPYSTGAGDASVGALGTPANLRLVGVFGLQTTTSSGERTFRTEPMSVAQAFGGVLPAKYSILIENQTGVVFSTSTVTTATYLEHGPLDTTSGN